MATIQYQTQRLSLRFFILMLVLFLLQVTAGLVMAAQEADPTLCVFRSMPATDSGACRARVPVHVGPPFRSMPAGGK